ncbi:preprotein translocase subunit SecG [SAR202 cluster bacterium AD-804-J14_MRT_500m]|nr:preprotein translocase subunit SecG [SAR202 cluster bacterium AD-804-J14_MRT_500m]
MDNILNVIQILISVSLVLVILFQVREMGTGLFGSATTAFRVRRGLERVLFQTTIILVILFISVSIVSVRLT